MEARAFWLVHDVSEQEIAEQIKFEVAALSEGIVWNELRNLFVFRSYSTIDHIAFCLSSARRLKDVLVVGSFTHQQVRVIGPCKDKRVFELVDFAKGLGRGECTHEIQVEG